MDRGSAHIRPSCIQKENWAFDRGAASGSIAQVMGQCQSGFSSGSWIANYRTAVTASGSRVEYHGSWQSQGHRPIGQDSRFAASESLVRLSLAMQVELADSFRTDVVWKRVKRVMAILEGLLATGSQSASVAKAKTIACERLSETKKYRDRAVWIRFGAVRAQ